MATSLRRFVWTSARATWVVSSNMLIVPSYGFFMLVLLPLRWLPLTHDLYWNINGLMYRHLLTQVALWCYSGGYTVTEIGDDVTECASERTIFLCNHQSTFDVPGLMTVFTQRSRIAEVICWVMDVMFKFTHFGFVSSLHGDFFVQEGKASRHEQPVKIQRHLKEVFLPRNHKWLVLFPEGGFLCNRKEASQRFAKKNDFPVLENVALPRVTALHAVIEALSERNHNDQNIKGDGTAKWLIDATLMYPAGKPLSVVNVLTGDKEHTEVFVHYKKHPMSAIPRDIDGLTKWLYHAYETKDKLLAQYYETGELPSDCAGFKRPVQVKSVTAHLLSFFYGGASVVLLRYLFAFVLFTGNAALHKLVDA